MSRLLNSDVGSDCYPLSSPRVIVVGQNSYLGSISTFMTYTWTLQLSSARMFLYEYEVHGMIASLLLDGYNPRVMRLVPQLDEISGGLPE